MQLGLQVDQPGAVSDSLTCHWMLASLPLPGLPGWASAGDDVTGPAGTLASRGGVIPKGASPSLRRQGGASGEEFKKKKEKQMFNK